MDGFLTGLMVGGVAVSGFSFLGGLPRPKSFAGLFAAAPAVAIATLILTVTKQGKEYAILEAKSMFLGAVAFTVYAWFVSWLLVRHRLSVLSATSVSMQNAGAGDRGPFLAFPAIFPATATLLQKNEKRKKEGLSKGGGTRGREAAGLDAAGAAIGGIGLIAFAITVWQTLPSYPLSIVLAGATLVWLITSVRGLWQEIPIGRGSDERQVSVRQQPVSATARTRPEQASPAQPLLQPASNRSITSNVTA